MDRRFERLAQSLAAIVSRRSLVKGVTRGAALGVVGLPKQVRADSSSFRSGRVDSPQVVPAPIGAFPPASPLPRDVVLPTALRDVPLDPQVGFDLPNGRFRATFVPRAGIVGPQGHPELLLQKPMAIGIVITCLKDVWWIESEPAADRTFNLVLYHSARDGSSAHQAVMSGQGVVDEKNGASIGFSVQTLTPAQQSEPIDAAQVTGMIRSNGSALGTFESEYCRKKCHDHCGKNWSHKHCRKRCDRKCS